jgi:hypothetical protein
MRRPFFEDLVHIMAILSFPFFILVEPSPSFDSLLTLAVLLGVLYLMLLFLKIFKVLGGWIFGLGGTWDGVVYNSDDDDDIWVTASEWPEQAPDYKVQAATREASRERSRRRQSST